jgi:hypothetical protein
MGMVVILYEMGMEVGMGERESTVGQWYNKQQNRSSKEGERCAYLY